MNASKAIEYTQRLKWIWLSESMAEALVAKQF